MSVLVCVLHSLLMMTIKKSKGLIYGQSIR